MDASKLLNVLIDVKREYDATANLLQDITKSLNSNEHALANKLHDNFVKEVENGQIVHYTPSNLDILNFIGGSDFFGSRLLEKIDQFLNSDIYSKQSRTVELTTFIEARNRFISEVSATKDGLTNLNFKAHFFNKDIFEVGILMPEELTNNKVTSVTKELLRWDKVFKDFKELVGESREDTKLDFISNGSLQFFIENSATIGACLAVTLERILKLYKNILDISAARKQLKDLGVTSEEITNIEKQEKDKMDQGLENIAKDLIKEFAIGSGDKGRLNGVKYRNSR